VTFILFSTYYVTQYYTVYVIVSKYYTRLPDGTQVVTRTETRYVTPEEFTELKKEGEKRGGRTQAPVTERPAVRGLV